MISPDEIHVKASRKYYNILRAHLKGEPFSLEIKGNKTYKGLTSAEFREQILALNRGSKLALGYGYSIQVKTVKTKDFDTQQIPEKIYFEHLIDYLNYLSKAEEFANLEKNAALLKQSIPALSKWIEANPKKIIDYACDWQDIIAVIIYLSTDFIRHKYYLREIPVNVHTKFIEQRKGIIEEILWEIIPDKLNPNGNDFRERVGFIIPSPMISMRIFSTSDYIDGVHEQVALPIPELNKIEFQSPNVFIVENATSFHTFPIVNNTILICGNGYGVEVLKDIDWLKNKKIYYWGDMDTDGFAILDLLRTYYPGLASLFMSMKALKNYETHRVPFFDKKNRTLLALEKDELMTYVYLKNANIRIEQEKIPNKDLREELSNLSFDIM